MSLCNSSRYWFPPIQEATWNHQLFLPNRIAVVNSQYSGCHPADSQSRNPDKCPSSSTRILWALKSPWVNTIRYWRSCSFFARTRVASYSATDLNPCAEAGDKRNLWKSSWLAKGPITWLGTRELRILVPIGEQTISWLGGCHRRMVWTQVFNSSSHGSSVSGCNSSSEFARGTPGSLVIRSEKNALNGASGCSPQLRSLGTGIPAALAICMEMASSRLVRSVHFITSPNGSCATWASKYMPNQEQYHREKWYRALWMIPHRILTVLLGTCGTGGVVWRILDGIDRGQV